MNRLRRPLSAFRFQGESQLDVAGAYALVGDFPGKDNPILYQAGRVGYTHFPGFPGQLLQILALVGPGNRPVDRPGYFGNLPQKQQRSRAQPPQPVQYLLHRRPAVGQFFVELDDDLRFSRQQSPFACQLGPNESVNGETLIA